MISFNDENLYQFLQSHFPADPDAPCLILPDGQVVSYGALQQGSFSRARELGAKALALALPEVAGEVRGARFAGEPLPAIARNQRARPGALVGRRDELALAPVLQHVAVARHVGGEDRLPRRHRFSGPDPELSRCRRPGRQSGVRRA